MALSCPLATMHLVPKKTFPRNLSFPKTLRGSGFWNQVPAKNCATITMLGHRALWRGIFDVRYKNITIITVPKDAELMCVINFKLGSVMLYLLLYFSAWGHHVLDLLGTYYEKEIYLKLDITRQQGCVHFTPENFENPTLFLPLGLPPTFKPWTGKEKRRDPASPSLFLFQTPLVARRP